MNHPAIHQFHCDGETVGILLDMIERCAPKFMRRGGGSISSEIRHCKVTEDRVNKILRLKREDPCITQMEIARQVGVSAKSVWSVLKRHGIAPGRGSNCSGPRGRYQARNPEGLAAAIDELRATPYSHGLIKGIAMKHGANYQTLAKWARKLAKEEQRA